MNGEGEHRAGLILGIYIFQPDSLLAFSMPASESDAVRGAESRPVILRKCSARIFSRFQSELVLVP